MMGFIEPITLASFRISVSNPMLTNARQKHHDRIIFTGPESIAAIPSCRASVPVEARSVKIAEAATNPRMNFGSRFHIS